MREYGGKVAGAGANVEDTGAGPEVGEERGGRGGVHVGSGDGGGVADWLRGVNVWGRGGKVSAIDLEREVVLGKGLKGMNGRSVKGLGGRGSLESQGQ